MAVVVDLLQARDGGSRIWVMVLFTAGSCSPLEAVAEHMGRPVRGRAGKQAPNHIVNNLHVLSSGSWRCSADGQHGKGQARDATYLGLLVVARFVSGPWGAL